MTVIKFGTDGWRAKMGKEFTFGNVRRFAIAYANYLKKYRGRGDIKILINYDTRFLSQKFARETAKTLSLKGIRTYLPRRDVPLAAASLAITEYGMDGGIAFTASFNQPIYNGIKVFEPGGAPAMPSVTSLIEMEIEKLDPSLMIKPQYPAARLIEPISLKDNYCGMIEELIDFSVIRKSGFKIIVDNLFGASRDYLDYLLVKNGIEIESIHNFPYASYGRVIPYCSGETLKDLSEMVKRSRASIGLATDIDGDRFGIVDAQGQYIPANLVMPPLIEYLIRERNMQGGVVKSVSTTQNISRVAEKYGRQIYLTPVGFKYIADMMSQRDAFLGVESTNGAALRGRVRQKDGILFNFLVLEMMAVYGRELSEILNSFYLRYPRMYNRELSVQINGERLLRFNQLLAKKDFRFDSFVPGRIQYVDGIKFIHKSDWLLIRKSGTSPVFRIYAESDNQKRCAELLKIGRSAIA